MAKAVNIKDHDQIAWREDGYLMKHSLDHPGSDGDCNLSPLVLPFWYIEALWGWLRYKGILKYPVETIKCYMCGKQTPLPNNSNDQLIYAIPQRKISPDTGIECIIQNYKRVCPECFVSDEAKRLNEERKQMAKDLSKTFQEEVANGYEPMIHHAVKHFYDDMETTAKNNSETKDWWRS